MSKSKRQVEAIVSAMGVFMAIMTSLVELIKKLGGTMENLYRLATPEGKETLEAVAQIIVDGANRAKNKFFRLISEEKNLILDATDGSEVLANATGVFDYVDPDFKNWNIDKPRASTPETPVEMYEMIQGGTFAQLFGSLSNDVGRLCLTQDQIKNFVKKYRQCLQKDGYGTFFLFKSQKNFFVAGVIFGFGKRLEVRVSRFEYDYVWYAVPHHCLVVPRLT